MSPWAATPRQRQYPVSAPRPRTAARARGSDAAPSPAPTPGRSPASVRGVTFESTVTGGTYRGRDGLRGMMDDIQRGHGSTSLHSGHLLRLATDVQHPQG